MGRDEHREQMRCQVERLLATDLGVTEWCSRNNVPKQTMYYWLTYFAEHEPALFGGNQNIVDSSKRRWVESTRKNMAASKALVTTRPAEVLIVDSAPPKTAESITPYEDLGLSTDIICVDIRGAHVTIPAGTERTDIEKVIGVVASL